MLERFFEKDTNGTLKGMTLEWACPRCAGKNFRILTMVERRSGEHHDHCRYCRARYRVAFLPPSDRIEGEAAFMDRLEDEEFSAEEQQELVRDFAEIGYMRYENPGNREITGKQRLLEEKITFFKRRRRL
jgi:transcription elongation factor Elf1